MRRAADLLTARLRGPSPEQPPSEYYLSHAIYALADAMRQIAEEDETHMYSNGIDFHYHPGRVSQTIRVAGQFWEHSPYCPCQRKDVAK